MDAIVIVSGDRSLSTDSGTILGGQGRLPAKRAKQGQLITSGILKRLARLGEQLDAIKERTA